LSFNQPQTPSSSPPDGAINGLNTHSVRAVMNLSSPMPLANTPLKSRLLRLDLAFV
jgi:hypothetical protein